MSMSIDPRLLTTPIGAVVGLVIAKKVLKPDDQTAGNLAIGGVIGAGAGALAGQFIKGERLSIGDVTEEDFRQNIRRNALGTPRRGTPAEIAALEKHTPGGLFPGIPDEKGKGWPWARAKHNFVSQKGKAGAVQQAAFHRANVQELTRTLKYNNTLTSEQQNKIRSNIAEHQRMEDAHRDDIHRIWNHPWRGPSAAAWGSLWSFIADRA